MNADSDSKYAVQSITGEWLGECHTTGSSFWTRDPKQAAWLSAYQAKQEVNQRLTSSVKECRALKPMVVLHPLAAAAPVYAAAITLKPGFSINEAADAFHALAWEKGWHSDSESEDAFLERACNNLHDEVSELHEAWRNNQLRAECDKAAKMREVGIKPLTCIEEEMADIVIRVFDNCRKLNVDIADALLRKHQFNATRPQRHGGKKS